MNQFKEQFLGIGPIDWLGDPHWAMLAIILLAVWKNFANFSLVEDIVYNTYQTTSKGGYAGTELTVLDSAGRGIPPGSPELASTCAAQASEVVVRSKEALAWTLREIGWQQVGNLVGLAAGLALPSVVLMMMFGQTRIFFVMSRDGLLPEALSKVHPKYKTPHVVTIITGIFVAFFAALFPVGALADISNSGTLFAFAMVAIAVLVLRRTDPNRVRPFRTPAVMLVAPLAVIGCLYLFFSLSGYTLALFAGWAAFGLVIYFVYGRSRSHVGRGLVEVHEDDAGIPPQPVPPLPGAKLD